MERRSPHYATKTEIAIVEEIVRHRRCCRGGDGTVSLLRRVAARRGGGRGGNERRGTARAIYRRCARTDCAVRCATFARHDCGRRGGGQGGVAHRCIVGKRNARGGWACV